MAMLMIGKDLDVYLSNIKKMSSNPSGMIKEAVYPAAGFVAQNMADAIKSIPVDNRRYAPPGKPMQGLPSYQIKDLLDGFGISKFQDQGGYINVKLGFDGYTQTGNGEKVANMLIARALTSGTSFRVANPCIRNAVVKSRSQAENMIKVNFDSVIKERMK